MYTVYFEQLFKVKDKFSGFAMNWLLLAIVIEGVALLAMGLTYRLKRLTAAYFLGFNTMLVVVAIFTAYTLPLTARHAIVWGMVVIYLVHMNGYLFWQAQLTALPKLEKSLPPSQIVGLPLLLVNGIGWVYCLPFYFAMRNHSPLNWVDALAVVTYIIGSIIHYGADWQKIQFKLNPQNRGRLLTTGFWRLSRHPNYFGDFLIYVAFAIIGRHWLGWISPLFNWAQYWFDAIPKNEAWAAERYGEQWHRYCQTTPKFVPTWRLLKEKS